MTSNCPVANALLACWLEDALDSPAGGERMVARWFSVDPDFDRLLTDRYADLPARVADGAFAHWRESAATALAALIALDQLPRNLYRGTARAYAYDGLALALAEHALAAGYHAALHPLAGAFFNLPFEHAEDPALQRRAVAGYQWQAARAEPGYTALLQRWVAAGNDHLAVIERFGRFPHRNAILGRASTPEETSWLAAGGHHWGQVPPGPQEL